MSDLVSVRIPVGRRVVSLQGDTVPAHELDLHGVADMRGEVVCVKLDDGREVLVRCSDLEVVR